MKKLIGTATLSLVLTAFNTTNAQKIAHINRDSLVSIMPEAKAVKDSLQLFYAKKEKDIVFLNNEFQSKYQQFIEKEKEMSDVVKKVRQEELQRLQMSVEEEKQNAQQQLQEYQAKLIKPIQEKVKKAIQEVAKEKKYKYVLDTSIDVVLYSEPSDDIFADVKAKLKIPASPATPAPTMQPKK